jgi:hypothetical protein
VLKKVVIFALKLITQYIYVREVQLNDLIFTNHRIGCCIEVILITWLLWQPIQCNSNGLNEGNRTAKSFKQLFNQNHFDPLTAFNVSTNSSWSHSIPISSNNSSSSSLNNLNLNYLLSLLQEDEEHEAISGVINDGSEPKLTQTYLIPNQKKDGIIHNNEIELGMEDRRGVDDPNKLSLFSSSLNVIDVEPQNTQLAHSVLIIHRPKPNKTVKPTIKPQLSIIYLTRPKPTKLSSINSPIVTAITNITTTTASYPTPVKNNHRPMVLPFLGIRAKPSTTSPHVSIFSNSSKTTQTVKYETPIIFKNNHKKPITSMFTRQKLSTEYATTFTTPSSLSTDNKSGFSEYSTLSTPLIRPPYVTPISHQTSSLNSAIKRPPIKIMNVNSNKLKQPEEVLSLGITVLDPPYIPGSSMKLPVNTTIMHKNLIVPMKEGRPKPVFPIQTTTQFPVYPIVAGITRWQTQTPTNSWAFPTFTTNSPEKTDYTTVVSEPSDSSFETSVTAQSLHRPTIITSNPIMSEHSTSDHLSGHASHIVTVTPIKGSDASNTASNTFIVTHSAQTPKPTSTTGYVNAIWAPPMPVISRPVQTAQQSVQSPLAGGWFSPFTNLFSVDSPSGVFSFLTILKTVLFTVLVLFLPPLTLAAALMQAATG